MLSKYSSVTAVLAAGSFIALSTIVSSAEMPEPAVGSATKIDEEGSALFAQYCALCHGADGRGVGPLSDAMHRPAADLTQIAKRNNGFFPFLSVAETISKGGGVSGHTPSRMPAWEKIIAPGADPIRRKAIIFDITKYLDSLQER